MNYNEAKSMAEEIGKTLKLSDLMIKKENRIVVVEHFDGSYLEFHSAAFRKLDKEWMAVFTEHHGTMLYHYEDVKNIRERSQDHYLYTYKY